MTLKVMSYWRHGHLVRHVVIVSSCSAFRDTCKRWRKESSIRFMPVYVSWLPRLFGNTSTTFFPPLLSCDITTLFVSCKDSLMATCDVVEATEEANSELHLNNQDR